MSMCPYSCSAEKTTSPAITRRDPRHTARRVPSASGVPALLLALLLCVILAGCVDDKKPASSELSSETEETLPPALDKDIATLLTAEDVTTAMGLPMDAPLVIEDGTGLQFYATDLSASAQLNMEKMTRADFDSLLASYADTQDTPNLGEAAKWQPANRILAVYDSGYMLEIIVQANDASEDRLLTSARSIAASVITHLEAAA